MLRLRRALLPIGLGLAVLAPVAPAHAAPAWLAPDSLDSAEAASVSFAPETAQSADGDVLAVWQRNASSSGPAVIEIWHAERPAGGDWTAPAKLSTATGVGMPAVARNAEGAGLYAWVRAGSDVRFVGVAADGTLGVPANAIIGQSDIHDLRVAVAPNGDRLAVWQPDLAGTVRVAASVQRGGTGPWSVPQQLSAGATAGTLDLAATPGGSFVAAWGEPAASPRAAVLPPGGAWQPSVPLDAAAAGGTPSLAHASDGTVVAVWGDGLSARYAERTPSNGIWQPAGQIATTAPPAEVDDVTVDFAGDRWVARWREQDPAGVDDGIVRGASRVPAGAWGGVTTLSAGPVRDAAGGAVAGLGDGRAIATWVAGSAVRASVMAPGGAWGPATSISPSAGAVTGATASGDGAGNALVGWDQADAAPATTRRVEVAAYDGVGPRAREPYVPRTAFVNVPYRVRAEVVDAWSALSGPPAWRFGGPGRAAPRRTSAFGIASSRDAYLYSKAGSYAVTLGAKDALAQSTESRWQVSVKAPRRQQCRNVKASRRPKARTRFRVRVADIRANQRLGIEAIRKLNAVQKWLEGGIRARDICGGSLPHGKLHRDLVVGTKLPTQGAKRANPRPLKLVVKNTPKGKISTRPRQFAINQRVTAAAIRRLNALTKRMNRRLTGGDIANGTLGRNRLVQGTAILAARPTARPAAKSRTDIVKPTRKKAKFTATTGQVRTNYRIAREALIRANRLYDRARRGLTAAQFKNGSITSVDFAPGALPRAQG